MARPLAKTAKTAKTVKQILREIADHEEDANFHARAAQHLRRELAKITKNKAAS